MKHITLPKNKWLLMALAWLAMGIYALIFREPTGNKPPPFAHFDKLAHFLLFLGQTWLSAKIWLSERRVPPYMLLLIFGVLYALGSELAQHFLTTTRLGDVWDFVADMAGVLMGLHLARLRDSVGQKT